MSNPKTITIDEAKQAKTALEIKIKNLLTQFSTETGAQVDSIYIRSTEFFIYDGKISVDYDVEIEVKL